MNRDYDNIARFYDLVAGWSLMSTRRAMARLAAQSRAKRVLDVGCGTGLQVLEYFKNGLEAVGVDNSHAMLERARLRLRAFAPAAPEGSLIYASGADLPFADASFDLAAVALVLHESAEEPFAILDEMLRVAPRLFILDYSLVERNLDYPAHLAARFVESLAGKRHYASYRAYMRGGGLEGLLLRYAGRRPIKVAWRRHMFMNTMLLMQVDKA